MSNWWKERGKRVKTGPQYTANVPDLMDEASRQKSIIFQDAPIPIEYFELQHFYSWYQGGFDYQQYVKQKRDEYAKYMEQKKKEMEEMLAKQSRFRRSKRFKNKTIQNYKEYSPSNVAQIVIQESDSDDFSFSDSSSSSSEDGTSDEEYVMPQRGQRKKPNKVDVKKNMDKNKNMDKKSQKVTGKKRKYKEIKNKDNQQNGNKKKKRKVSTNRKSQSVSKSTPKSKKNKQSKKDKGSKKKNNKNKVPALDPDLIQTTKNITKVPPIFYYGSATLPVQSSSSSNQRLIDELDGLDLEMQSAKEPKQKEVIILLSD